MNRSVVALLVLACSLLVAACGGSNDDDSNASSASASKPEPSTSSGEATTTTTSTDDTADATQADPTTVPAAPTAVTPTAAQRTAIVAAAQRDADAHPDRYFGSAAPMPLSAPDPADIRIVQVGDRRFATATLTMGDAPILASALLEADSARPDATWTVAYATNAGDITYPCMLIPSLRDAWYPDVTDCGGVPDAGTVPADLD